MNSILKIAYTVLKYSIKIPLGLFLVYLFYLNIALYYRPSFKKECGDDYNADVYAQLQYLKLKIDKGAATDMQKLFPEGYLFMNLLYGLSWANFSAKLSTGTPKYLEAMAEMDKAIAATLSPRGKATFHQDTPLPYGAYYVGWTNYLIGRKLALQDSSERDSVLVEHFLSHCEKIDSVLKTMTHPYPASYRRQAWPADVSTCIAALALHDRLFPPKYAQSIENWVAGVKKHLDPKTGLIPHSVVAETANMLEKPEGSSMSLILVFMKEIDPEFGQAQFELYKKYFLAYRFGLPGIRAYAKGNKSRSNIDSGPVILGIGGAGSIVGQQTMALYGDWKSFHGLRNSIEAFGMPFGSGGKKSYIFGKLPMADAFIAWSNSIENTPDFNKSKGGWRWGFHLLSLGILAVGFAVFWWWR